MDKLPYVYSATPPATPPASPFLWLCAAGANGENWMFRFNGAAAETYAWEFIGGPPVATMSTTSQTLTASTWTSLNTNALTVPRAGDYILQLACSGLNSTSGAATEHIGIGKNGSNIVDAWQVSVPTASFSWNLSGPWKLTGLAAGDVLTLQGFSNSATTTFVNKYFSLVPVRVS